MLHSVELFSNLLEKNCKLNSIKLIRKCIDMHDRQRSSKLVAVSRKRREQLTHACCSHAVIRLRHVQRSQLFALFACFGLQLPLLSFVADSVTVHEHEYVYLSTLWSSLSTFSVNLPITVRNVTSRNKYSDV